MKATRPKEQRVVITGLGINTTVGDSVSEFWKGLAAGRSGVGTWVDLDPRCECRVAADLTSFDLEEHLGRVGGDYPERLRALAKKLLRATPISGRLTCSAALQAYVDAGLTVGSSYEPERFANVLAGHNFNVRYIVDNAKIFADDPEYIEPLFGMLALDTDVLGALSELLCLKGPGLMVGGACASGNLATLSALDMIRAGRADAAMVSGGALSAESATVHGWAMIDAVSYRSFNDTPTKASRPFDVRREGFIPCIGAAAVVLESLASAERRGARIYAEILGGGSASDGSRLTRPHQDGQERAMKIALRDAGIHATQIDYVNAHATSTPLGDAVEVAAIKAVLGEHAYRIPVNATKSMTGHGMTSAGVIELVATALQMRENVVHPTINLEEQDPTLDLDFVPNAARDHKIEVALSNSFGFGGINSSLVLGRVSERG